MGGEGVTTCRTSKRSPHCGIWRHILKNVRANNPHPDPRFAKVSDPAATKKAHKRVRKVPDFCQEVWQLGVVCQANACCELAFRETCPRGRGRGALRWFVSRMRQGVHTEPRGRGDCTAHG